MPVIGSISGWQICERAGAADPVAGNWLDIFALDGLVAIRAIIGVRTVIQAGGASNMQLRHAGVANTVLCEATAVTGNAVNTIYYVSDPDSPVVIGVAGAPIGLTGIAAMASIYSADLGGAAYAGTIQVAFSAAGHTGSTAWLCLFAPISRGADLTAA